LFLLFHPSNFHSSPPNITLYNRSLPRRLLIASLSPLLRQNFFLLDLSNNFQKCITSLSTPPKFANQLATLGSFLTNTLLALSKSLDCLNVAIPVLVNFVVTIFTFISKQPVPSPPPLSTPNLTCNSTYYSLPKFQINPLQRIQNSRARSVVKAPKYTHKSILKVFCCLTLIKVLNKLFSLT